MSLIKIFNFKGLFQAGRRMDAPLGSFRRFTNSFKDKSGRIKGYSPGSPVSNTPTSTAFPGGITFLSPVFSAVYKGKVLELVRSNVGGTQKGAFRYFNETNTNLPLGQVYAPNGLMDLTATAQYLPSGNFTSALVNDKLFFCEYVDSSEYTGATEVRVKASNLLKFDGYQISSAGLPTPWKLFEDKGGGGNLVRAMYFTIGHDAEPVFSNYLQWSVGTGSDATLCGKVCLGAYTTEATPGVFTVLREDPMLNFIRIKFPAYKSRRDEDSLAGSATQNRYYNKKWIYVLHPSLHPYTPTQMDQVTGLQRTYVPGSGEISLMYCKYSADLAAGDWVIGFKLNSGTMFQVKSVSGTTVKVFTKYKAFNIDNASWEEKDLDDMPGAVNTLFDLSSNDGAGNYEYILSNIALLIYSTPGIANPSDSDYKYSGMYPICWDSNYVSRYEHDLVNVTLDRPKFGVIQNKLIDFYDKVVPKTTFPALVGITSYSNLLVGFDANALYFNDTALGGSTEMVSGISNLVPFGAEFGKIVAICGSERFLLISRERKNYVLTGELTTGNVSISECDSAIAGAFSAKAVSNVYTDKILLMNDTGIYAINSNGGVKEISADIRDFFSRDYTYNTPSDGNLFKNDFMKTPAQKVLDGFDGGRCKIVLEEKRGFILFLTAKFVSNLNLSQSNILVYDTTDGSWYEWTANSSTSVECLSGKVIQLGSTLRVEEFYTFPNMPKQVLLTQWITMGEPSLEKQLTQVKLYGTVERFLDVTSRPEVYIGHQTNWEKYSGTPVMASKTRYPAVDDKSWSVNKYAHKQRLDSTKPQAFSLLLETTDLGGEEITVEGIEIEVAALQEGVKK